jgi:hypothetical protein
MAIGRVASNNPALNDKSSEDRDIKYLCKINFEDRDILKTYLNYGFDLEIEIVTQSNRGGL